MANISDELSINRAREAFERADLGGARGGSYREPSYGRGSDDKGTKSEIPQAGLDNRNSLELGAGAMAARHSRYCAASASARH